MKIFQQLLVWIIPLLQGSLVHGNRKQCFVPGECINSNLLEIVGATDQYKCLKECQADTRCTWFTYDQELGGCRLLSNCLLLDDTNCPQCISGESACTVPFPFCWFQGKCRGNVAQVEENVPTVADCLWACKRFEGCTWFTYFKENSSCALMFDCPYVDVSCVTCFSGISECGFEPKRKLNKQMIKLSNILLFLYLHIILILVLV